MLIMVNYDRRNDGVLGKELHLCTMIAGLKLPTDPRWVNLAAMDIGAILTDHAIVSKRQHLLVFPLYNSFLTMNKW